MMPPFDPSKLDPKVLMELSELVRQLPPEKINRMQSLMHNMMAGFDVRQEMEEFERTLPAGFREKLVSLMGAMPTAPAAAGPQAHEHVAPIESGSPMDVRDARPTILRAVKEGNISPEEAEKLLFG